MEEDRRLIEQIKLTQSSLASSKLVDKYKGRVFTFCLRVVNKDRGWAEEIAQDALIKALNKINSLKDPDRFFPWLMRLTYNVAMDHVRKKKVPMDPIEYAGNVRSGDDPHQQLVTEDRAKLVEMFLMRLPEEDRAIVTLYYLEDLGVREIETITGLSLSNIKVKLFRARQALRKDLEKMINQLRND